MNLKKVITNDNKDLYDDLKSKYKFKSISSKDNSWGFHFEDKTAIVSYASTKWPASSFTHELLHYDLQEKGYKRIRFGLALDLTTTQHMKRLVAVLDNEFQHVKMFPEFTRRGFNPSEFYNDADNKVEAYLNDVISKPNQPFILLAVDYITLLAPGGQLSTTSRNNLKALFHSYEGQKYEQEFLKIADIFDRWSKDTSNDAEKYIQEFFTNLNCGKVLISYKLDSLRIPEDVFFCNGSMDQTEIDQAKNNFFQVFKPNPPK